ncbi:Phosphomannomutase/phosphoglucomutase [Candidatus Trichorickettsia mobilis]|uniref:Phosphomannomutase/phosphoglucomutase n=1 Tax=Candidatus Trichorickettsia mobilis TaxID=1346319 RepID=A0ABZ0UR05_9RICK|nr:Phosphomannomutase/phosphoglucomutase [Candidatus Trichorickettsia mobilis]
MPGLIINPIIFRAYDIRGNAKLDVTTDAAYKIGFCFTRENITTNNSVICVGRDGRHSSDGLYRALVEGIIAAGGKVISVGVVPTPVLYFADVKFMPAASIMITGSHNQKDDNGFKMVVQGKSFFGEQIQNLLSIINNTDWEQILPSISDNNVQELDIYEQYITEILDHSNLKSNLKIVWDPGNGAACKAIKLLQNRLTNNNIIINGEIDGDFPNHHPDPTVAANLTQLIEVVQKQECDCGIAFDGDADRIGIVTRTGGIVWGDQLLCLFAMDILALNPGATIIMDVKTSQVVFDQIRLYGGNPLMWKTGHSFIKNKMREVRALLAGEMSGHLFFADRYYGYDDAIYAAVRLIELLSKSSYSLDEMLSQLPHTYNTPEIRIKIPKSMKFNIINSIKTQLIEKNISFNDVDGLRVNTDNGWWLMRASNTEEAIIIRCESCSSEGLIMLKTEVEDFLTPFGIQL